MRAVLLVVLVGTLTGCQKKDSSITSPASLTTKKDSISYVIGLQVGNNLRRDSVEVDLAAFAAGMRESALDSTKRTLTQADCDKALKVFQDEMVEKQMTKARNQGMNNKKEGDDFLAANKTKEGVVTLPDGLQYKVITEGTGPMPKAGSTVSVHYRGTLLSGEEFDSSYKRGQPATFPVSGVIRGWTEALQKMHTGSKWILWIPPDLAYGERGAGGVIPPNATLTFEVELLSIK